METLKTLHCGKMCGEARVRVTGERIEIAVEAEDPGDGLYRAVLVGERGRLTLGMPEMTCGRLRLCRRPFRRDVEQLGKLLAVETVCAFRFPEKTVWEEAEDPSVLLRTAWIARALASAGRVRYRREGDRLVLALELKKDGAFPLETLFCFAGVERVAGERCVVYEFDRAETPLMPR